MLYYAYKLYLEMQTVPKLFKNKMVPLKRRHPEKNKYVHVLHECHRQIIVAINGAYNA